MSVSYFVIMMIFVICHNDHISVNIRCPYIFVLQVIFSLLKNKLDLYFETDSLTEYQLTVYLQFVTNFNFHKCLSLYLYWMLTAT